MDYDDYMMSNAIGNGVAGSRNAWIPALERGNPIVKNNAHKSDNWARVMPGNHSTQENEIVQSRESWTPMTPRKPVPQRSNMMIQLDLQRNQLENDNWQDLIGIYKDLLQGDALDLNVLQDLNPISPPPIVQNSRNPGWITNTTKKNLSHGPCPDHSSNQDSSSFSYFHTNGPVNWKNDIVDTTVDPKNSSTRFSATNGAENTRSTATGCLLGTHQYQPSTSDQLLRCRYNLKHLQAAEPDAASSSTTGFFPSPNNQGFYMNNQRVPQVVRFPVEDILMPTKDWCIKQTVSVRNEDADIYYNEPLQAIGDSCSAVVFEGDKQGIGLNETPDQKTPSKRKKHRPKVVVEGKPKRTPKPKDPKDGTSGKTVVKRKYVKKKGSEVFEAQQRKKADHNSIVGEPQTVVNRKYVRKKGIKNLTNEEKNSVAEAPAPGVRTPNNSCKRRLNFDLNNEINQYVHGGVSNGVIPGGSTPLNFERARSSMLQSTSQSSTRRCMLDSDERRGTKRPLFEHTHPCIANAMDSFLMNQKLLLGVEPHSDHNNLTSIFSESHKRNKTRGTLYDQSPIIKGRARKHTFEVSVDDLIYKLEGLHIYNENKDLKNALVPYRGDNTMIPFELIKKRKPRPRVDLDAETHRVWRVLMGKEESEGVETVDKDKEKWWEDERRVFRGRVDSFIARMHLVQGDRRFSQWKGSVVDSVIGVFLTQNVTDHLSSSAFMSLAARFSLKSRTMNQTSCQDGPCVLVEEPIEIASSDNMKCHENIEREAALDQSSFVSCNPSKHMKPCISVTRGVTITEEEVILSQHSIDSFTIQNIDEVGSSSGSNSEDNISIMDKQNCLEHTVAQASSKVKNYASHEPLIGMGTNVLEDKNVKSDEKKKEFDWDSLRKNVLKNGEKKKRSKDTADSIDYGTMRRAHVNEISDAIKERGMNNMLADRIKIFLTRLMRDHGSIDLEWLRDVPPDQAKDYLLSIRGLGLKSVECVRLLALHHLAFPVDTNVGRIAVRLGWVPLQPLPESLQLHLLEMYPVLESIQKYLWPRLCKLDQLTLYELHYQMITFGKVFCTKSKPNCNACPMRAECRHFASAFASARLALPGPEEKRIVTSDTPIATDTAIPVFSMLPLIENNYNKDGGYFGRDCAPIIEEPTTPEQEAVELSISDIEDQYYEDSDEIPTIKLNMEEFTTNLQNVMQDSMELQGDMSKALVSLKPEAASIPTPKLKNVSRLRTEHQVYELPDSHPLLKGFDRREHDDPSPYLLAIWTPGETADSIQIPERVCVDQEAGKLCNRTTCFSCNSIKEANSQMVRGTILMPCRTATQGSFPLNGTYFQVNEVFADHASSLNPIDVPRAWIWNLPRRTVYFGTTVSTIFKGLTTEEIQYCFWRGFVCVRGFDQKTRAPRPLMARLHFRASKMAKQRMDEQLNKDKSPG